MQANEVWLDVKRHGVKVLANGDIFHFSNVQTAADTALQIMKETGVSGSYKGTSGVEVITPEGACYSAYWELRQLVYGGAN